MKLPFVRNPFNYDRIAACDECCIQEWEPSKTQQSQAAEADINEIMRRFGITGQMPETPEGIYGNFDRDFDFREANDILIQAREAFMRIPPNIRQRFGNDPAQFHDFCIDPENLDELRRMGLAAPRPPETHPNGATGTTGNLPANPAQPPGNRQEEPPTAPNPVT